MNEDNADSNKENPEPQSDVTQEHRQENDTVVDLTPRKTEPAQPEAPVTPATVGHPYADIGPKAIPPQNPNPDVDAAFQRAQEQHLKTVNEAAMGEEPEAR